MSNPLKKRKPPSILVVFWMLVLLAFAINACSDFAKSYHTYKIKQETCTSCKTCVPKCTFGAISRYPRIDGPDSVVIDPQKCVGCGECIKACPWNSIEKDD